MNKIVLGLAAALIGTAAYAQTSTDQGSSSGSQTLRKPAEQGQSETRSSPQSTSGSPTSQSSDTHIRSRPESSRVGVGMEARERSGVSMAGPIATSMSARSSRWHRS